ncbi:arsenic resistance protein [Alkalihalobacterium chitinilyticum]|uniref:Arsenic resistance protein n=1 Tax=Alkalihalobacterium chitinilyticum TaxID=2980103 RepID=A0ABT5VJZ9_9BACI|nr:bile acid:sodium symporter [Alkalihalobacterium chitinilyticum]MDE5415637.1 arsenic resistance protein [Alkalihalobacterium chitinilyticum]
MNLFEKLYSLVIILAVVIGLLLGQLDVVSGRAEAFIVPLLVAMLYITFLQIPVENIKESIKNKKFTALSLLINFIWVPILAWLLAFAFLSNHPALYIGFIMLMVTPCTDWYLIFTSIAKGNVALSTAILPLNLILQILLLPVYLLLFGGTTGVVEWSFLLESVLLILLIPFIGALLTKALLRNKQHIKETFFSSISLLPMIFLSLAIVAMFSAHGQLLFNHIDLLWKITIPILCFFVINFMIGQKIGKAMNLCYADRASLSLTTLARNSPIALAIAMTAFPDEPLIALTLVIGPLLELPILALISQVLLRLR